MKDFTDKLKANIITAAQQVNDLANLKDVNRNHVNYGRTTAYADVLRALGHEIDIPVYGDDNGCLRIPKVNINGKVTDYEH